MPMKKLMHILFLSCYKATELIERKLHLPLTLSQRIQLAMHKKMCKACSLYEKQSATLDKALYHAHPGELHPVDLEKLKQEILARLKKSD